jgi:glutathione peroxidase
MMLPAHFGKVSPVSLYDIPVNRLDGSQADLRDYEDKVALVVNVASKCGLTPQYEALEQVHERYAARGFSVLGFPCNQFAGQEPGTAEDIATFCSTTYGVTFPLFEKTDVNGADRHAFYGELTKATYDDGEGGDIKWNFEKFLVVDGKVVKRWNPTVAPDAPEVVEAIEAALAPS